MPTTASPRRATRTAARRPASRPSPRASLPRRRRPQPQSKGQQVLGMLTKALPSAGAAKKVKPRGKGRNLALLGVAGGLAAAIKNRDKLSFGRGKTEPVQPPAAYEPPPAGGPAVVPPAQA